MSALGAEGRRFESCLPDHISAVSRHSRAATHGLERKNESGNGAEVPGIVPDGFGAEADANARLIAAAPALLEALELAVSYGWQHESALDAIASARGEV